MKRFSLYFIGVFLLLFGAAHACNFKIYNFGDSAEKSQETSFKKMGKPDPYGGLKIQLHAELICKEKSFENTLLKYFFVEDKLVRITLERVMMKDRNLMDVFYKHYKKKIPDQVNKLEWRGSLEAESQDSLAFYIVANLDNSQIEILDIYSKRHSNLIEKYLKNSNDKDN